MNRRLPHKLDRKNQQQRTQHHRPSQPASPAALAARRSPLVTRHRGLRPLMPLPPKIKRQRRHKPSVVVVLVVRPFTRTSPNHPKPIPRREDPQRLCTLTAHLNTLLLQPTALWQPSPRDGQVVVGQLILPRIPVSWFPPFSSPLRLSSFKLKSPPSARSTAADREPLRILPRMLRDFRANRLHGPARPPIPKLLGAA